MRDLTSEEKLIANLLGQCAHKFGLLDPAHQDDLSDFVDAIHTCQNIVLARPATEAFRAEREAYDAAS